jgi:hypothetical protein
MKKIFLFLVIIGLQKVWAGSTREHVQGLIELKKNKKETAFPLLEKAFTRSPSPEEKASISILLAQSQGFKLSRNRAYYAQYALRFYPDLELEDRIKLHTVVGDGFFDEGDLTQAELAYRAAMELTKTGDRNSEYALYKLGWVQLSLKKPVSTYVMWTDWLNSGRDFGLRDAFVSALGKVWVEAQVRFPMEAQGNLKSRNFLFEAKNQDEVQMLAQGLHQGINRDPPPDILSLLERVRSKTILNSLGQQAFEARTLFAVKPCDVIPWLSVVVPTENLKTSVFAELSRCAQEVSTVRKISEKEKIFRMSKIATLFEKLEPEGNALWPLNEIYSKAGMNSKACEKSQQIVRGILDERISDNSPDALEQAYLLFLRDCKSIIHLDIEIFASYLSRFEKFYLVLESDMAFQESKWISLLLKSFENPSFRKGFLSALIEGNTLWSKKDSPGSIKLRKWLAQLLLENMKLDSFPYLFSLSHTFDENDRIKYASVLVKTGLAQRKLDRVQEMISEYLAWRNARLPETFQIWSLLRLSPEERLEFLDAFASALRRTDSKKRDVQAFLYLISQELDPSKLWNYWDLLKEVGNKDSTFGILFFEVSLANLSVEIKEKIAQWAQQNEPFASYLFQFDQTLISRDFKNVALIPPDSLINYPLNDDIRRLRISQDQMNYFSNIQFKDDSKLVQTVQASIKRLSGFKQALESKSWHNARSRACAESFLNDSIVALSSALLAIKLEDTESQNQLQEIVNTIKGWSKNSI